MLISFFLTFKKTLIYLKIFIRNYFLYTEEKVLFHIVAVLFKRYSRKGKAYQFNRKHFGYLLL